MMMGDLLAGAANASVDMEAFVARCDPDLCTAVQKAMAGSGLSFAAIGRAAVADFSRFASGEDWSALLRSVRDTDDPAAACLTGMVRWHLDRTPTPTRSV